MHDALGVRRPECLGDLERQLEASLERRCTALGDRLAQGRSTLEVLLHHEVDAVLVADVVYRGDVRMVQRGGRTRLLLEPRETLRVAGELGRQHLDRHLTAEPVVLGQVHLTHTAFADLLDNLVRTQRASFHLTPRHAFFQYLGPVEQNVDLAGSGLFVALGRGPL